MRKWHYFLAAIGILILGICAIIFFAKAPLRIALYDPGSGEVKIDIESMGRLTIELSGTGEVRASPLWKQSGADILIKNDLSFQGKDFKAGDRLMPYKGKEIIKQSWHQKVFNDIKYLSWKVKHLHTPASHFVRVEEVDLRSKPEGDIIKSSKISFGTKLKCLETREDWLKVRVCRTKNEGWIHRHVATESRKQVATLLHEKRVPRLMLLIQAQGETGLEGLPIAGVWHISEEVLLKGDLQLALQPRDCLLFDIAAITRLPKPCKIMDIAITDPSPGKLYFFDNNHKLSALDLISLD